MGARKKAEEPVSAGYLEVSRTLAASFVFIVPLFALYEVALAADEGVRSGTVPLVKELFHPISHLGLVAFNLVLLGLLCLAVWRTRAQRRRVPGLYGLMFVEACLWSGFMLAVAYLVSPRLLVLPPLAREMLAYVGAGIYEEFLFRFLLLNGLIFILYRGLGMIQYAAIPIAILASAALFSYAHHTLGTEPFDRGVFLYRALMGVILGTAFWLRGLGVVVYAHAIYNVALAVQQHAGT